jgi:hypothetical protein
MAELPASYLSGIANQIMSVSAFLGGFAATFLGTLQFGCPRTRTGNLAIVLSAVASCSFVVSVLALAALTFQLHPDVPAAYASASRVAGSRTIGLLGFLLGIYSLLTAIGLCGWTRSRRLGLATSAVALSAGVFASWAMVS